MTTDDALTILWNLVLREQAGANTNLDAFEQIVRDLNRLDILDSIEQVRRHINHGYDHSR